MRFLAHHFDDPEQQFDSGKLGIWLFLVTEVLFFSGMFCAYALYRSLHPEVFVFASQFLNAKLGAFNTGVLLFSSLSMAWGVRCAQMRQRTGLVVALSVTLGCAAIFLGVKAIEYSHKWDMGLLVAGYYWPQSEHLGEQHEGISIWLIRFSIIPAMLVVGFLAWYLHARSKNDKATAEIAGPFLVTALCFFVGVGVGMIFQSGESHGQHGVAAHADAGHEVASQGEAAHGDLAKSGTAHNAAVEAEEAKAAMAASASNIAHNAPAKKVQHAESSSIAAADFQPGEPTDADVDQRGRAGIFFSIYYCMTGIHALHIIGGIIVLGWLLVRATKDHFNEQYFGPVDYVGLYWHLVDLIWIYLFPLLYLIK
jgi:cytochrome c oxidase subunit 3